LTLGEALNVAAESTPGTVWTIVCVICVAALVGSEVASEEVPVPAVGCTVGTWIGDPVGVKVGVPVGKLVGVIVGVAVGIKVGVPVGKLVGATVGEFVGAPVVGACVETTVFVSISDADAASLTVAEASAESAGAFDTIAVDKVLLETAVVNSDARSVPSWLESSPAVGAITTSKEMLVDPDRRVNVSACMFVIWSIESIIFSDATKAVLITSCAAGSLFKVSGSTSSITIAVVTTAGFVGAIVGVCEGA